MTAELIVQLILAFLSGCGTIYAYVRSRMDKQVDQYIQDKAEQEKRIEDKLKPTEQIIRADIKILAETINLQIREVKEALNASSTNSSTRLTQINDELKAISNQVTNLTKDLSKSDQQIAQLEGLIKDLKEKYENLQSEMSDLKANVKVIQCTPAHTP